MAQTNRKAIIILDLCGGTGSWSKPYKEAGYDVRNITLPENDVRTFVAPKNVYGVLAAPPCTEFSLALNSRDRNFKEGLEIVEACLKIIWKCRLDGNLKWWAMENPRGFLRQFMGKPAFHFEQWEFNDEGIKPTDLWGYFNFPKKATKERPEGMSIKYPNGRKNAKGWSKSAVRRAITPEGFATAFYKSNK